MPATSHRSSDALRSAFAFGLQVREAVDESNSRGLLLERAGVQSAPRPLRQRGRVPLAALAARASGLAPKSKGIPVLHQPGPRWGAQPEARSFGLAGRRRQQRLPSAVKEDALFQLCRRLGDAELTRCEMGLLLKQGLLKSKVRIGQLATLLQHTHVGTEIVSQAPRDILPLPVRKPDLDEDRIPTALAGGATPARIRKDFKRTLPRAGRAAWFFLLVMVVNFLHLGWSDASSMEGKLPTDLTEAQLSAHAFFDEQVEYSTS